MITRSTGFSRLSLAGTLGLMLVCDARLLPHASAAELTARVAGLKGQARYSSDRHTWQALKNGTVLRPGGLLQTAPNSEVDILFEAPGAAQSKSFDNAFQNQSATALRVLENTVLGIDQPTSGTAGADAVENLQLDLQSGRVAGSFKPFPAGSRCEIKLARGMAGVRDGRFQLEASGAARVQSGLLVVSFMTAEGSLVATVVAARHSFDPNTGQVTEATSDAARPASPPVEPPQPAPSETRPASDPQIVIPTRKF